MPEWPFGIGDARIYTVVSGGARVPERGERIYFVLLDSARIGVSDVGRRPLGEVLDESARLRLRHTLETKQEYIAEAFSLATEGRWQARVSWPVEYIRLPGLIQVVLSARARKQVEGQWQRYLATSAEAPPEPTEAELVKWLQQAFAYQANFLVFARTGDKPTDIVLLGPTGQLRCEIRESSFVWAANGGRLPKNHEAVFAQAGVIEARAEWHLSKARLPEVAQGALNLLQAIAARSEYFGIWQQYRDLEQDMLTRRVAALKPLNFRRTKYYDDVVRFFLEPGADTAAWQDEALGLSAELVTRPARRRNTAHAEDTARGLPLGAIRRVRPDFIDVDRTDDEPGLPDRGQLRVSPIGDVVRLARQQAAFEQLVGGRLPLPDLQALLSDGKTDEIRTYSVPAFTSEPARLADGSLANERQREAVARALNTPDICVIQGPPGTGKTSVIRTILRRLKEEGRRHLLVSSHQHTAVDNVLKGMSASGVVAYRFGGNEESESYRSEEMDAWVQQVSQAIEAEIARLPTGDASFERRHGLKNLVEQAAVTHMSLPACQELLSNVLATSDALLPGTLARRAEALGAALASHLQAAELPRASAPGERLKDARRALSALPASQEKISNLGLFGELWVKLQELSHAGFGAADALAEYKRHWNQIAARLPFARLGSRPTEATARLQEALDGARQAAQRFLDACQAAAAVPGETSEPAIGEDYWRSQFQDWCRQVAHAVGQDAEASSGQVALILQRWHVTINNRPALVRELFSKHADVWGVTCQQSVAQRFGLYDAEYDCVVIDEAARTSPLDLIIPLVRARRIILVGDHRQLPHALDYQLEKEFETTIRQPEHWELLKASLFARLYDQLPASKRVRLKVQYRMHPVLGRMVSQVFYSDDPLEPAPSTSTLVNDTGLFGERPVAWLDTSNFVDRGEEGQYYNPGEMRLVVECVRLLVNTRRADSLGVITYYAQQRDLIQRHLRDHVPGSERVQVGSVDAFQGEQKDVIILSTVRSNSQRRIGFLSSPNRINVSVSRARRLLVIVGNASTVSASPYLKSIFEFCKQANGVLSTISSA